MNFFAGRGEYPAAGLFSTEHIIMLVCCVIILILTICFTLRKPSKNPYKTIRIVSIVVLVLEILKMIWGMNTGRYANLYDYLPLWFCSLFIPFSLLAGFTKGKVQKAALGFMYYGGLVGGIAYLLFPTTSLGRFPALHFISFHSMFYHTLMIYMSVYVIYNKLIQPNLKDAKSYLFLTTSACVLAYVVNAFLDTNYMFLSGPSNNAVLKAIYDSTGSWYPIAITVLQNTVSFFAGLIVYKIGMWVISRIGKRKKHDGKN